MCLITSYTNLFVKYMLFIFNLIFVLSGIILLIVGAVIQASYSDYDPLLDESFFSVPVLLIVIGTIIFVVSFFGCCGAYKGSYCLIISFCVSLCLIFILELSGGIAGYLLRDRVSEVLDSQLSISMKHYNTSSQIRIMWDEMQSNLLCCGDTSPMSWGDNLPQSCCADTTVKCVIDKAFKDPCTTSLKEFLQSKAGILGGFAVGIAIIQLLGIIFACNLASSIKGYESV
ncbi:UNVERIFIED_CONTAM: hypothetical protein PYX00_005521 [Menopon gallinae]|uniref:Tetraspanin n=1 Tax=Menopon gallinae TaxID=328185 RepID=A0AAW2HRT4_9NEOP